MSFLSDSISFLFKHGSASTEYQRNIGDQQSLSNCPLESKKWTVPTAGLFLSGFYADRKNDSLKSTPS